MTVTVHCVTGCMNLVADSDSHLDPLKRNNSNKLSLIMIKSLLHWVQNEKRRFDAVGALPCACPAWVPQTDNST